MVRGLALETSGRVGSVALVEDGAVVLEEQFSHGLKHASGIVRVMDALCLRRGWGPRDIREIYVSAGPGSFTGLRVGVTVAKSLAFATGAATVAVPTAEVLARNAPAGWENLVVVLDAKREQVFAATFVNRGGEPVMREAARLDALAAVLGRTPRPVHLVGEGIPFHQKFIPAGDASVIVTPPELWRARAAAVAGVGYAMARRGEVVEPDRLAPVYVRRPEAEEKYEAAHGKGG